MKKVMRKMTVLMLTFVMIIGAIGPVSAFAEGETPEVDPTVAGLAIPFGTYEPNDFVWSGGNGNVTWTCSRVHVTNVLKAEVTVSSISYPYATVDGVRYEPYVDKTAGTSTFTVPFKFGKAFTVSAHSDKMGTDINYDMTVTLDKDNLKAVNYGTLQDGFYTTVVNLNKESYGYKVSGTKVNYGFGSPDKNYDFPVTVQIKDGKIADVAYTTDVTNVTANTNSDINYLLWAMEGQYVSDAEYNYMKAKSSSQYNSYNVSPYPAKNGKGLKAQLVGKDSISGVDTVTKATITSRAVLDSVDASLAKAEHGEKDDPEPELPVEDTSDDIIPADGVYSVKGTAIGTDLGKDGEILLEVKDGKMAAKLFYLEERQSSYDHMMLGKTEDGVEPNSADFILPAADYDYDYYSSSSGNYMPGSLYRDIPIKSLDKPLRFVIHAYSSDAWYNRLFTFDSATLQELSEDEVELKNKQADLDVANADVKNASQAVMDAYADSADAATIKELKKAIATKVGVAQDKADALQAVVDKINGDKDTQKEEEIKEAQKAAEDAQKKIDELNVKIKQVKGVKVKAGKKKATVSWKKLGAGYKYQVFVSTQVGSGFKRKATVAKLKTVVKKLKSKKIYYVRVRGVKKVNGKNVFTAFSELAKVKVK